MWFLLSLLAVILTVCFSTSLFMLCIMRRNFGRGSLGGAHALSDPPQTSLEHDQLIAVVRIFFYSAYDCLPLHP